MKIKVDSYKQLEKHVQAFHKNEDFILLFVVGDPGLAKTTVVEKVVHNAIYINAGTITAFKLYMDLFHNKDKIFILDDCDQLWSDRTAIRLLKSLCQTKKERQIEWGSTAAKLDNEGVPRKFTTTSRVVVINNRWKSISQHVESLDDRGIMLDFNPPVQEVFNECKKWFGDKEILRVVESNLPYITKLSMRKLYYARVMKKSGMKEWKTHLLEDLGVSNFRLIERLSKVPMSEVERQQFFEEETGLGRASYFNYKNEYDKIKKPKTKRKLMTVSF